MRRLLALALGAAIAWPAPALALEAPGIIVLGAASSGPPLGHFRLGMAGVSDAGINALLGGQGMSLGLDLALKQGFALAFDSINMYRPYDERSYLLSINPVQLRYRLALPTPPARLQPYVATGAGLSLLGLFAGEKRPEAALGLAASAGLGVTLDRDWTLELGLDVGQANNIAYSGWQVRLGSGIPDIGRLFGGGAASAPPTARAVAGKVEKVSGDLLTLRLERAAGLRIGDGLLVSYMDDFPVRVARAVVTAVDAQGRATARVVAATEPVKRGYDVRAW